MTLDGPPIDAFGVGRIDGIPLTAEWQPPPVQPDLYTDNSPVSPLQYPGGKTRARELLLPLIMRPRTKLVVSPFFGGGSVELALAHANVQVVGYEKFAPLANFWRWALEDASEVGRLALDMRGQLADEETGDAFRDELRAIPDCDHTTLYAAAAFFTLNRTGYSAQAHSSYWCPRVLFKNMSDQIMSRLEAFRAPGVTVSQGVWQDTIPAHPDARLFLDPPYPEVSSPMYGRKGEMHKDFDHEGLAKLLRGRGNWIMTNKDCETVRDLYAGLRMQEAGWQYSMGGRSGATTVSRPELIIFGDD